MRRFWGGIACLWAGWLILLTVLVTWQRRQPPVNELVFVSASINLVNYYQVRVDNLERRPIKASTLGERAYFYDPPGASVFSPQDERVYTNFYASVRETEIQIMRMDTLTTRELTLDGQEYAPVWSPDGAWIAYHALEDNQSWTADLYRVRSDGSGVERLTATPDLSEESPSWSPDGAWIAFVERVVGGEPAVFIIRADGTDRQRISPQAALLPAWSPDGRTLAYSGFRGTGEIYLYDLAQQTETQITDTPGYDTHPRWSPDGVWIAFESSLGSDTDVYAVNVQTGEQVIIAATSNLEENPQWIIPPNQRWQPGYVLVGGVVLLGISMFFQRGFKWL